MATQTFNEALATLSVRRIDEAVQDLRISISVGSMSPDAYKFNCGKIAGLIDAKDLITAALTDLMKA